MHKHLNQKPDIKNKSIFIIIYDFKYYYCYFKYEQDTRGPIRTVGHYDNKYRVVT